MLCAGMKLYFLGQTAVVGVLFGRGLWEYVWRFTDKNLLWPEPCKVQVQPLAEIVGYSPGISPSASTSIVLGKCLLSKYTKVLQQPLVICSYKPVLLGGSTFGKLVTAN